MTACARSRPRPASARTCPPDPPGVDTAGAMLWCRPPVADDTRACDRQLARSMRLPPPRPQDAGVRVKEQGPDQSMAPVLSRQSANGCGPRIGRSIPWCSSSSRRAVGASAPRRSITIAVLTLRSARSSSAAACVPRQLRAQLDEHADRPIGQLGVRGLQVDHEVAVDLSQLDEHGRRDDVERELGRRARLETRGSGQKLGARVENDHVIAAGRRPVGPHARQQRRQRAGGAGQLDRAQDVGGRPARRRCPRPCPWRSAAARRGLRPPPADRPPWPRRTGEERRRPPRSRRSPAPGGSGRWGGTPPRPAPPDAPRSPPPRRSAARPPAGGPPAGR